MMSVLQTPEEVFWADPKNLSEEQVSSPEAIANAAYNSELLDCFFCLSCDADA
jgi:hypothetical protein